MRRVYYQSTVERIRQLRLCLLVHSYIYYELDTNIVSDHQWQAWADELVQMQQPIHPMIGRYDEEFRSWTGATGFHLPRDEFARSKAHYLLRIEGIPIPHKAVPARPRTALVAQRRGTLF